MRKLSKGLWNLLKIKPVSWARIHCRKTRLWACGPSPCAHCRSWHFFSWELWHRAFSLWPAISSLNEWTPVTNQITVPINFFSSKKEFDIVQNYLFRLSLWNYAFMKECKQANVCNPKKKSAQDCSLNLSLFLSAMRQYHLRCQEPF